MKFKDNLPIYLQIEDYIYLQIAQGKLQAGEKLPSVRALALELTVNANTVQRALREMTAKGYIFTKRGEGNFVTMSLTFTAWSTRTLTTSSLLTFWNS